MKKSIIIGLVLLATLAGVMTVQALAGPQPADQKQPQTAQSEPVTEKPHVDPFDPIHTETAEVAEIQATERPQEAPKTVQTYQQPSQPAAQQAAPQQSQPAPEKTEPLQRIPFTNEPVTAGDPQSYVGTVGQCPFYEIAGEKGCVPPPDIECNADWSVCKLKVQ